MPTQPHAAKGTHYNELWEFESELRWDDGAENPVVVLGVDGGATTTISICLASYDSYSEPTAVSRAVYGSSNLNSVSEAAAKLALEQSMAEALMKAQTPRSGVKVVVLAVSGVDVPSDAQRLRTWLRSVFPSAETELYVYNDAVAALASGTGGKRHGCVLIAGTGTIAFGVTEDGRQARAAGNGPLLGDLGSGYAISSEALHSVMRACDGRGPPTTLTSAVLEKLHLSKPEEIIRWIYADLSWARVAALVPTVKACAKDGDEVAQKVLNHAVEELAGSVKAVIRALKLHGKDQMSRFPFVLVGGVLENEEGWDLCKPLISLVSDAYPDIQAIRPTKEPAFGAAMVAWRHYEDSMKRCH